MTFKELNLLEPILNALTSEGYTNPTPIQEKAIPILLAGRDIMGCAQTGTGKTAAFAIPILQRLTQIPRTSGNKSIRSLIVIPTFLPKFIIDKKIPEIGNYINLTKIELSATEGVKELRKLLEG